MRSFFTFRNNTITGLFAILALACCPVKSSVAQTAPNLIFDTIISSGLSSPVDIANSGDGTNRFFVVQQGGRIRIISGGVLLPGSFLDISDSISTGGERGLLSIAFHPGYNTNRYFFVYYTNLSGDITVARFQTQAGDPNVADEPSGVVLLRIPKPFSNHNGGKLLFGPDGMLYFATGDGGSGGDPNNLSQNGNSLLGKMIRLDVDDFLTPPYYQIPADNPYVSDPLVRDEIFAIGLRNPFRWSFDRLTNEVWIADVGQNAWEEINNRPFASSGGINYGWRCYEGNAPYNTSGCLPPASYISPIFVYPHNNATGGFSVTGGFVYRAAEFPAMYGYYICADYVSDNVWLIYPDGLGGFNATLQAGLPGNIAAFGEAENGDLYALSLNGLLYKVTTNTVIVPVDLLHFSAKANEGYNELGWRTTNEQNLAHYEIEFSADGVNYTFAGRITANNNTSENNYSYRHTINSFSTVFYRLKIIDKDARSRYSNILTVNSKLTNHVKIYPSPVTGSYVNLYSEKSVEFITLLAADGKKIFEQRLNNVSGTINITVPVLPNGLYILQVRTKDEFINQKLIFSQQ